MARIEGVDLPRNKRVEIGLTYIFGIGRPRANEVLAATGIDPDIRVMNLTDRQVTSIRDYISSNFQIEGDLRRERQMQIKRLMETLTQIVHKLAASAYQQASPEGQPYDASAGGSHNYSGERASNTEEEVVDAEYEEVN